MTSMSTHPDGRVRMFNSHGTRLMVFPRDSLTLDSLSYVIDDNQVTRHKFMAIPRDSIYTLSIIPRPVNIIYMVTRAAAQEPEGADSLPAEVCYYIDGLQVSAREFAAVPRDSVVSVAVKRATPPAIYLTTRSWRGTTVVLD